MIALAILHGSTDPRTIFGYAILLGCVVAVFGLLLALVSIATDAGNRLLPLPRTVVALTVVLVLASALVLAQEEDPGILLPKQDVCAQLEPWSWWWIFFGCYARVLLIALMRMAMGW